MNESQIRRIESAADRIEAAQHKLSLMFEYGYGGAGCQLVQLLEQLNEKEIDYFKQFIMEKVLDKKTK